MNIETIFSNISVVMIGVAIICTLVSIITEFTKQIGIFNKIANDLQVLILTEIVDIALFFMYLAHTGMEFKIHYLVAVIFVSFPIALICCKGWEYFMKIWGKYYREKPEDVKKDDDLTEK